MLSAPVQSLKPGSRSPFGLLSLPEPPHSVSENPADTTSKRHLDLASPLFPCKATTYSTIILCHLGWSWPPNWCRVQPRMAMNAAQHKTVNLLKTL